MKDLKLCTNDARWYKIKGWSEWIASGVVKGKAPVSTAMPPVSGVTTRKQRAVNWALGHVGKS